MSTQTPKALTVGAGHARQCGNTTTDSTAITAATIVTVGGVINTVGNFVRAGCMRKTGNGYSIAAENDPEMLSVHNLV